MKKLVVPTVAAMVAFASAADTGEQPVMYRCPGQEYKNTLSEEQAKAQGCVALSSVEWKVYARDQQSSVYEYNVPRIKFNRASAQVETWNRVTLSAPDTLTWPNGKKTAYSRTVTLSTVQCGAGTLGGGVAYYYDAKGANVWTDQSFKPALAPPPDSTGELLVRELCAAANEK